LRAAVEVLEAIETRHRPAAEALADWGKSHRFAGSGDRAAIGNLVYDVLRRRLSLVARMGGDTPRALVLGAAKIAFGMGLAEIEAAADGSPHALEALSADERAALARETLEQQPAYVTGDFPEWLAASFARAFGEAAAAEGEALARRAPVDLRVNTLKADREKVVKALARHAAQPTQMSPVGVRIAPPLGPGRTPNVEAEAAHGKGWFEVQDEGSQIAALLAGAGPRQQVLDLCAGAGGKTLALAAQMQNTGQIYAYDESRARLRPIFERLKRAGARNVQVLDGGDREALAQLGPRFDLVLVDAPCTGSGVWRRRPDAKWRLRPANLAERQAEQRAVLDLAAASVKPGGRIVYVTCSVLPEENTDSVEALMERTAGFAAVPFAEAWRSSLGSEPPVSADGRTESLLLTPARHGCDGFFVATLRREV
jgi:16S rRNA (cytosine967-C5)-methyltransferase